MPQLHQSVASLRIAGDDLDPPVITRALGCNPTSAHRKGDKITSPHSSLVGVRKTSLWLLEAPDREPGNLDAQVRELLGRLSQSLETWKALGARYSIDLYCGFFMRDTHEGLEISAATLHALAQRGVALSVELYAPLREEADRNGA
jgi:Domain of unknown function (DUF4279)